MSSLTNSSVNDKLVSVIIPTYNRVNIIHETLDSLLRQSFSNWEGIVVDDGSTDSTLKVLKKYNEKDKRIKFYSRPTNLQKGANSCRNYGFRKSLGEYIIWFDSDDLMTREHIETKLQYIRERKLDFVVARTQNFENGKLLEPYHYEKKEYGIKASDFILLKIHWYTYDVMLKREIAEKISWNEDMNSWQDYNYFCKMLLVTENGDYIDKVLTHRRLHPSSIQATLTKDQKSFNTELLENRLLTYKDIYSRLDKRTEKELIYGLMNLCFEISRHSKPTYWGDVAQIVKKKIGKRTFLLFLAAMLSSRLTGKGYSILESAKERRN